MMKDVDQLIHQTESIDTLISILKHGIHSSYSLENFGDQNNLIPMISFSNIQFKDIGKDQVVYYGDYGIAINRKSGIQYGLNPVLYIYEGSVIENGIKSNFEYSILPQIIDIIKDFYKDCNCKNITDHVNFNPLPIEVKNLLNSISQNTEDDLVNSIKALFEKIFTNSNRQLLLAKPYKVKTKDGNVFISYNEREWRKSYLNLNFVSEFTPNGSKNSEFCKIINMPKPHLSDENYTLKFNFDDIKFIWVKKSIEVKKIKQIVSEINSMAPETLIIGTLKDLVEIENR